MDLDSLDPRFLVPLTQQRQKHGCIQIVGMKTRASIDKMLHLSLNFMFFLSRIDMLHDRQRKRILRDYLHYYYWAKPLLTHVMCFHWSTKLSKSSDVALVAHFAAQHSVILCTTTRWRQSRNISHPIHNYDWKCMNLSHIRLCWRSSSQAQHTYQSVKSKASSGQSREAHISYSSFRVFH